MDLVCGHCGDIVDTFTQTMCWVEGRNGTGYGHRGYCCGCFDLSCGKPLDLVNERRKTEGKSPVKPWPKG